MQFAILATLLTTTSALAITPRSASASASPSTDLDLDLAKRYATGRCGVHFVQHQKNEKGVGGEYEFDITIKDNTGGVIGGVSGMPVPDFTTVSVDSQLPYTLDVGVGSVDSDAVSFRYDGYEFTTGAGCSVGRYDSGTRQGDCGFAC